MDTPSQRKNVLSSHLENQGRDGQAGIPIIEKSPGGNPAV